MQPVQIPNISSTHTESQYVTFPTFLNNRVNVMSVSDAKVDLNVAIDRVDVEPRETNEEEDITEGSLIKESDA